MGLFPVPLWRGELLSSPIAFDTETTAQQDLSREIPDLVLATVSDGTTECVLRPEHLPLFLFDHVGCAFVGHNVAFDFWVVDQWLARGGNHPGARSEWWRIADEGRLHDTMLMDMLLRIAAGKGESGGEDSKLFARNLGLLAKQYGIEGVDKQSEFRLRYHELIGADWDRVDPGFFDYALGDVKATHAIWLRQIEEANAFIKKAPNQEIYPDATERFGRLTEKLQVLGAISLAQAQRNGLRIDREYLDALEVRLREEVEESKQWLHASHPGLFKTFAKTREFKTQEKSGLPQMNNKVLVEILADVSRELGIDQILSKGKTKRPSTSTKAWQPFRDQHTFLKKWSTLTSSRDILKFFAQTRGNSVHPRYIPIVNTGRTACEKPNIQQCFSGDTEILTTEGWVSFWVAVGRTDLRVAQYHEDGTIDFVIPEQWIEQQYSGTWVSLKNEHIDLFVTEDHNCLLQHRKTGAFRIFQARDYKEDYKQINAGMYAGGEGIPLSDSQIQFLVATQADGTWSHHTRLAFTFSKTRKIDRFEHLLQELGLQFNRGVRHDDDPNHAPEQRRFYIPDQEGIRFVDEYLGKHKTFGTWVLQMSRHQLDVFCEEIFLWDGLSTTKNHYSSSVEVNTSWVQIALSLSGRRTVMGAKDVSKWGGKKLSHEVWVSRRNYSMTTNIARESFFSDSIPAYCVTVPSGYVMVRRNGKAVVTGNCPKRSAFREGFTAQPGNILYVCDYAAVELRTFAAICLHRFGRSRLAEIFNNPAPLNDPHCYTAAYFEGVPFEEFLSWKSDEEKSVEYKKKRQASKPLAFGAIGGLGGKRLVEYAAAEPYFVHMTLEQAEDFRDRLINEVYPEMGEYLQDQVLPILARNLELSELSVAQIIKTEAGNIGAFMGSLPKVLLGKATKADGSAYKQTWITSVWATLRKLIEKAKKSDWPIGETGWDIHDKYLGQFATTPTGRLRGGCRYTQIKNTPFQGLAADGAKLALWRLTQAGYRIAGFIHDEIIIELPKSRAEEQSLEVKRIMEQAMSEVLNHAVPVEAEGKLTERWTK